MNSNGSTKLRFTPLKKYQFISLFITVTLFFSSSNCMTDRIGERDAFVFRPEFPVEPILSSFISDDNSAILNIYKGQEYIRIWKFDLNTNRVRQNILASYIAAPLVKEYVRTEWPPYDGVSAASANLKYFAMAVDPVSVSIFDLQEGTRLVTLDCKSNVEDSIKNDIESCSRVENISFESESSLTITYLYYGENAPFYDFGKGIRTSMQCTVAFQSSNPVQKCIKGGVGEMNVLPKPFRNSNQTNLFKSESSKSVLFQNSANAKSVSEISKTRTPFTLCIKYSDGKQYLLDLNYFSKREISNKDKCENTQSFDEKIENYRILMKINNVKVSSNISYSLFLEIRTSKSSDKREIYLGESNTVLKSWDIDLESKLIYTLSHGNKVDIWDLKSYEHIFEIFILDEKRSAIKDPESNEYAGNPEAIQALEFIILPLEDHSRADSTKFESLKIENLDPLVTVPFSSLDLKLNRPDKILQKMNAYALVSDIAKFSFYERMVQKRIRQNGFQIEDVEFVGSLAPFKINFPKELAHKEFNESEISLQAVIKGDISNIQKHDVFVNFIPIKTVIHNTDYNKKNSNNSNDKELNLAEQVSLSLGTNIIEIVVTSKNGLRSTSPQLVVYNKATPTKPDLYFVGIGIDEYNASTSGGLDALQYAVKDSKELEDTFKKSGKSSFGNVFTKVIANKEVTQASIKNLREFLAKSKIDDHVILFLSGHGIRKDTKLSDLLVAFGDKIPEHYKLRDKSDVDDVYYYMTSEANVDKPWEKAIPLDGIRDLVNGIPSRQKIMLVDTCQSGEKLDLDEQTVASLTKNIEIRKTRGQTAKTRGLNMITKPGAANEKQEDTEKKIIQSIAKNNALKEMSELFPELRRGTGTIEISAATGAQSALESKEWQNGAFTFVIKEAILKGKAKDKSGNITAQSLRRYVLDEVEKLTDGQQTPMVARDIAGRDFVIFGK